MDSNEQPPAAEQPSPDQDATHRDARHLDPGTTATRPSELSRLQAGPTSAEREAACRANHPSRWQPADPPAPRPGAAAAAHYEGAAIRWLATQAARFERWPESDQERAAALAALGDVAELVALRLRRDPDGLTSDYHDVLSFLARVAARADTRTLLASDPGALLPLVALHGCLRAAWLEDAALAQALDRTLAERSVLGLVRTPSEQLSLSRLLAVAGLQVPSPRMPALLATSLIADDIDGLHWSAAQIHDVTTIVMTATDFGATAVAWPAGVTVDGLAGALQEWLVLGMADDDPGLVGDLLAALGCLSAAATTLVHSARRWLQGWQESDGRVEGAASGLDADVIDWVADIHATTATALDALLCRTGSDTSPLVAAAVGSDTVVPELVESVMAAADWLDAVLPGTHVQGRLWTSEAWLALGDEDEARRQLLRLCDDPHIAFSVLKESGEQAVHLAALVVALGVTTGPLTDLCEDVAALLTHPEAADELLGPARARALLLAELDTPPLKDDTAELHAHSRALCADLLRDGAHTDPRCRDGLEELLLLARATRCAARIGDLGWLSLLLRGLHRLHLAPQRLVRDVARALRSQQRADGALCERPAGVRAGIGDMQVQWTLAGLTALVEELPRTALPDAA